MNRRDWLALALFWHLAPAVHAQEAIKIVAVIQRRECIMIGQISQLFMGELLFGDINHRAVYKGRPLVIRSSQTY